MRACSVVLVISAIGCGSGDSSNPPDPRAAIPAPVDPAKPPPPPIDLSLGNDAHMAHPIRDGRVSVIPIVANAPIADTTSYLTLAEGLGRNLVTVRELGRNDEFVVDTVRIKNKSRQPLFVMSGELILDGLQDRAIAEDRVIPPGKTVRVSVRCVEMGREEGRLAFTSGHAIVEASLRQAIAFKTQTDVWQRVSEINGHFGLAPPSKTYRLAAALQASPAATTRRDHVMTQLAALPDHERLVGLVQVVDGAIVSIDRFATPELFVALESELIGSYLASDGGPPHEGHTLLPGDVRGFMSDSWSASHTTKTAASTIMMAPPTASSVVQPAAL